MTIKEKIEASLARDGVALLPPMDVFESIRLIRDIDLHVECTMLDPWYNKGVGGVLPTDEYDAFIKKLLDSCGEISNKLYLWGFPEVIGPYVRFSPKDFHMTAWLTWYYKNCPSVIRGWRSSQNACIQFLRTGRSLYPEHFLSETQKERLASKKMRFIPGPPSVIESPLMIGFVGKKEQTGHPSQKPEAVFDKLILMATEEHDIIFDPMAGSGTTGASAKKNRRRSILSDRDDGYIGLIEKRLGISRLRL